MSAHLYYADTESCTDLFAAVPAPISDPFLFLRDGERSVALVSVLDAGIVEGAVPGVEVLDPTALGQRELVRAGSTRAEASYEVARRALEQLGIPAVTVNWNFPLRVADVLRAGGIEVTVNAATFADLRRVKTTAQIEGHRRAQRAAEAAMAAVAELLRAAPDGLTAEGARAAAQAAADANGADLPEDVIIAPNAQGASGHDPGSGPIVAGDTVIVDLWPRDRASRCWADMTRTFIAGGRPPSEEIATFWRLAREALTAVTAMVRPGVNGEELYAACAEIFEAAGLPTQRTAAAGEVLHEGFFHGLGHGVGLDVHEAPGLGMAGEDLVAGDMVAVEPGCYRAGVGGVRIEDLLLVTADGCEVLTDFPYEL